MNKKKLSGIELNISERMILLGLLPDKGNIDQIRKISLLRGLIGFDDAEILKMNIRKPNELYYDDNGQQAVVPEGKIIWDDENEEPRQFKFGASDLNIIYDILNGLNDSGQLTEEHISLYEKFME